MNGDQLMHILYPINLGHIHIYTGEMMRSKRGEKQHKQCAWMDEATGTMGAGSQPMSQHTLQLSPDYPIVSQLTTR